MPNINNCVPYRAGTCSSFVSSENGCKHEAKNPDKKAIRQFKAANAAENSAPTG